MTTKKRPAARAKSDSSYQSWSAAQDWVIAMEHPDGLKEVVPVDSRDQGKALALVMQAQGSKCHLRPATAQDALS